MLISHILKDLSQKVYTYYQKVKFPSTFASTPRVVLAQNSIWQKAPGGADWYGWYGQANAVTKSGFKAQVKLWDREIDEFYAAWIACVQ